MFGLRKSLKSLYFIDDVRRAAVVAQTTTGSRPSAVYYCLLGLSVLIAGFGLIANSPAVVIGAMLVSPLMTPIFGVALGLTTGDAHLLRIALVSMVGGVILAIGLGVVMGLIPIEIAMNREILSRTTPTLLDLLVATFAGLAGCIAMLNEDVSPILPGIAIATALVPPLAACGLCLSMGAFGAAWGAFLLFFANVLAIYFVAAVSFILAGFTPPSLRTTKRGMVKRFSVALVGLLVVSGLLTNSLIDIAYRRAVVSKVDKTLSLDVRNLTRGSLHEAEVVINDDSIKVLARVFSARVPSPQAVHTMQRRLENVLDKPVSLYVSCQLTRFVSASGSDKLALGRDQDGELLVVDRSSRIGASELAEQALRESLGERAGLIIDGVQVQDSHWGRTVLVSGQSLHKPSADTVAAYEKHLRERLNDPHLRLVILHQATDQVSAAGLSVRQHQSAPHISARRLVMEKQTAARINEIEGLWADDVQADHANGTWTVTAKVSGTRLAKPEDADKVEKAMSRSAGKPVKLVLWSAPAASVTRHGYHQEDTYLNARQQQGE